MHPEGRDFIRRIAESAGRMDNLVTDSLQYSKVIREELDLEPVGAALLLRGMIESCFFAPTFPYTAVARFVITIPPFHCPALRKSIRLSPKQAKER